MDQIDDEEKEAIHLIKDFVFRLKNELAFTILLQEIVNRLHIIQLGRVAGAGVGLDAFD